MNAKNMLLVYEEIPERTVILLLTTDDLAKAELTPSKLASIHGTYQNATDMTGDQEAIHDAVNAAIFGEWVAGEQLPAVWEKCKIFQTDEEHLNKEGMPPEIDGNTVVIHAGFAL